MKAFKEDKKQQERIEAFFKEETTYFPNHVLLKFCGILLIAISYPLLFIPYLELEPDGRNIMGIGFMLFAVGIYTYAGKYAAFAEPLTKKVVNIASLTQYLPVNRMQLTIFRIKKIFTPCIISTLVIIALRCLISYGTHGSLSAWDLIFPVLLMTVWPVLIELMRY